MNIWERRQRITERNNSFWNLGDKKTILKNKINDAGRNRNDQILIVAMDGVSREGTGNNSIDGFVWHVNHSAEENESTYVKNSKKK